MTYELPQASAQVKSCVLLAGLFAEGETCVLEPLPSRDHTERMLAAAGVDVTVEPLAGAGEDRRGGAHFGRQISDGAYAGRRITVHGPAQPRLRAVDVPGDPSSAAFLVAAAVVVPGSELTVEALGLNGTRLGFFEVLRRMGAPVEWQRRARERRRAGRPPHGVGSRPARCRHRVGP